MSHVEHLLDLAHLVLKLGTVDRATRHPDGVTPETDTTHTVMLALSALYAARESGMDLDVAKLLSFALVHDLTEAYAGDVNTAAGLSAEARAEKAWREEVALKVIGKTMPWVVELIEAYERMDTPEAEVVHYLDKVMPKLTHELNAGGAWRAMGHDLATMREAHQRQGAKLAAMHPDATWVREVFEEACERSEASTSTWEAITPAGGAR